MAKLFLRVLLAFAGLIALLALIGALLPRDFEVVTSRGIEAPPAAVFTHVNDLRKWEQWSSWNRTDVPDLQVEYSPQTAGEDATFRWTDTRGSGKVWITESDPPRRLAYRLEFGGFRNVTDQFQLRESGDGTELTWTSTGSLPGGPFYGWFGFFFESGLQYEHEKSLDRLKEVVEKGK